MTVSHTVKLQGSREYEMAYFSFTMTEQDLPEELRKELGCVKVWRAMEYIVQREVINLQLQAGKMSLEEAQARIEYLRKCLGDDLQEKVANHGC